MPPDLFIKVAERAGLIIDLGRLLIGKVCSDLVAHPELKIALNISPIQLMAPEFISILERELQTRGIEVCRVEIELTESVVVDDTILAAERLLELSAAGFTTALDDFGTGYSSMGYLARLPFQTVKIDRSFVSKLDASERNAAVVDGMIRIAHGLGLDVVCEGVETAEEWSVLRALGCDLGQGYYFDAPLPIAALAARWMNSPSLSPVPDPPQDAVAPFRGPFAQIA
jgi:EAL domain-containing protein (putative c-di-GMP-specific phosphodiesterase class I)